MKLIIDISQKDYDACKKSQNIGVGECLLDNVYNAVKYGKPYEERSQGEWIFDCEFTMFGNPYGTYRCSVCGCHSSDKDSFCKDCGAEMRTKEDKPCPCIDCTSTDRKRDCQYCEAWAKWSLE